VNNAFEIDSEQKNTGYNFPVYNGVPKPTAPDEKNMVLIVIIH
jgi:hypothetical protein